MSIKEELKYIKYQIESVFAKIRYYFKTRSKYQRQLVKQSILTYPDDFSYIFYLEELQFKNMLEYYQKYRPEYKRKISILKLLIKLNRILSEKENIEGRKVNTNNCERFLSKFWEDAVWFESKLYTEKCKNLYYDMLKGYIWKLWV